MKKISALILSLCAFAAVFLSFWYSDVLFNRLFVFGLIPMALSVLLLFGSLIVSIIIIARKPFILKSYLPIVISIITVLIIFVFPFRKAKVNLELQLFDKARMHVIEMVKNDEEQVISFWVFRGMLSGSVQLIYSSKDENLIYDNEEGHSIVSIEELKDHWYLVETDY